MVKTRPAATIGWARSWRSSLEPSPMSARQTSSTGAPSERWYMAWFEAPPDCDQLWLT